MKTRCLTLAWLSCLCASAQTVTGTFVGSISDNSRALIPGAAIEFRDVQRGTVKKTVSGPDGTYTMPYMQPGEYRVQISAPGFKTFDRSGIELTLGAAVRVDAVLEVGNMAESVTVTQSAPLLQMDKSEIERKIEPIMS